MRSLWIRRQVFPGIDDTNDHYVRVKLDDLTARICCDTCREMRTIHMPDPYSLAAECPECGTEYPVEEDS